MPKFLGLVTWSRDCCFFGTCAHPRLDEILPGDSICTFSCKSVDRHTFRVYITHVNVQLYTTFLQFVTCVQFFGRIEFPEIQCSQRTFLFRQNLKRWLIESRYHTIVAYGISSRSKLQAESSLS